MSKPREIFPTWLLVLAVKAFLVHYDDFLNTRTDEANRRCNTAVERLRSLIRAIENDFL